MFTPKTLFMLIGPKGSGKTHIGTLVNRHTDIVFLRVEPIWLSLNPGEDGWQKIEATLDVMFQEHDKVMIESLGIGEGFGKFRALLAEKYSVKMIRVHADLETCFTRVKTRNNAEHIPVSDDRVAEFNQLASVVSFNWDLEINNNEKIPDEQIIDAIQSINGSGRGCCVNLKKASEGDLEKINALVFESEMVSAGNTSDMKAFIEQYTIKKADLSMSESYVLYEDNFMIGFFMIKNRSDLHELEYFYIEQGWLGKGYGKILWNYVEDVCAKSGIRKLSIVCGKKLTGFYLRMGAERIGEVDSKVDRGVKIDLLQYQVRQK